MEVQLSLINVKEKNQDELKKDFERFPNKKISQKSSEQWQIFVDGAARGNPGPAGAGVYVLCSDEEIKEAFFLGEKTNNQAEYLALILALYLIMQKLDRENLKNNFLIIHSDSELLIKQLNGFYRIKNPMLIKLNNVVVQLLRSVPHKFIHVLRDKNKIADKLANYGIDKKKKIPTNFLNFLADFNDVDDTVELLKK